MRPRGHDESFAHAFSDLFPKAYRVAYRVLGNATAAEDAAAEALARAYADWATVGTLSYRDAWVLRVATNVAISAVRRKQPKPDPPSLYDAGETATVRVAVGAALRALSRRQREIVVMRYIGGLTEAEIAAALGISRGSVKQHAHRALATLRQKLGEETIA